MSTAKLASFFYDKIFKKTSTFVIFIGVSAVFVDRAVDVIAEAAFEKVNEGRLWKDVKKQLNLEGPK